MILARIAALSLFVIVLIPELSAQYYALDTRRELAITTGGLAIWAGSVLMRNQAEDANIEDIANLRINDLWKIDRNATSNYSQDAQKISDIILYSSAAIPVFSFTFRECRQEAGKVGLMAFQTLILTDGLTNMIKATAKRYRPFNYNPDIPESTKLADGSRRSFVSGHTSNTAALSFLTAKVITDIHPDMANKWIVWSFAAAVPAVTGYLRYRAGKHFPTDIIGGYILGTSIGMLIPALHRTDNLAIHMETHGGLGLLLTF